MMNKPHNKAVAKSQQVSSEGKNHTLSEMTVRSASLPDPEELAAYGLINPTFPDKIIDLAINEQKYRHRFNITALLSSIGIAVIMIICALIVSIGAFYIAYLCVNGGNATAAASIVTVSVPSLIAAFVFGRSKSSK